MAEEGVIIPLIIDVQDDGETTEITNKILRLRDALRDVDKTRRTSSGRVAGREGGIPDWKRIDRARDAIDRYIASFKKLDDNSATKSIEDTTQAINREVEKINEVISRNKALQSVLAKDSRYDAATARNDLYAKQIRTVEDLQKYYEALEQKLNDVHVAMQEDPARNAGMEEVATNIRNQAQAIDELVYKLGGLASKWSEVANGYESAYSVLYAMHAKEGIFAGGVSDKDLAEANKRYEELRDQNEFMRDDAVTTSNRIVGEIGKQIVALDEEIRKYRSLSDIVDETGKAKLRASKGPNIIGTKFGNKADTSAAVNAQKEAKRTTDAQIRALNEEAAAVKKGVSQYYYKLRAVKMLHFAINNIDTALGKFGKTTLNVATKSLSAYLKLVPGVARLQKSLSQSSASQKKFNLGLKNTTKEANKLNFSVKDTIKNLLKYGLGIRSLFVLFNRLRSAVISGFNDMAKIYDPVNKQLSSISASLTQLRNAAAAAVEPLLSVLAPALERIAALASEVAYKVASFIAALTGRSMVIRATRAQTDYAKSLDKTGKSAKKARNELAAFDDLDVLNKQDDSGGDGGVGAMFDEVPIDETMKDWAEKFKEFLDKLLGPIMKAWDRAKAYVINAFKYMCQQIKALWADVARDFWRVWEEFTTEQMFYFLFLALGDIMLAIGSIAKKIREAWNYAENGYRILSAIRDMAYDVAVHFRHMTAATRDWAESVLNLKPLFTAIADVLKKQVEPAFNRILGLVEMLYNNGLLELLRDFINTNLPVLVRGAGEFGEGLGLIARRLQTALETGTKVDGVLEYTRSRLQQILDKLEHFSHLISETFKTLGKDFRDWADSLNFAPIIESLINLLSSLTPMMEALFGHFDWIDGKLQHVDGLINKLWKDTILPFWKYLIEDGGPKLINVLAEIFGAYDEETGMGIDWEKLTQNVQTFLDTVEPFFELAWETLIQLIKDLGKAFDGLVNSDVFESLVNGFKDWVDNADPEELARKIEVFVSVLVGLKATFSVINKVFLPLLENWMTFHNFLNNTAMSSKIAKISDDVAKLSGTMGNVTPTPMINALDQIAGALSRPESMLSKFMSSLESIGGVVSIVIGAFELLKGSLNILADGFSIADEARVIFGAGLIGLGAVLLGLPGIVGAVIAAVIAAVTSFFLLLANYGTELRDALETHWEETTQKVEEFFTNLGHNLGVWLGQLLRQGVDWLEELFAEIGKKVTEINWMEVGENILNGILAIFNPVNWVKMFTLIIEAITSFVKGFCEGLAEGFDMHSPSKLMEPYGENILLGILEGIIQTVATLPSWIVTNIFTPFIENLKTAFGIDGEKATNMLSIGTAIINGIFNGILDILKTIGTWIIENVFNPIMSSVKEAFGIGDDGIATTFLNIGKNLVEGLKQGISDAWENGKDKVAEVWNKVTQSATDTYEVNSPSKVFRTIGAFLIEGMKEGIEGAMSLLDSALSVAFESIIKPYFSAEKWSELGTGINEGLSLSFTEFYTEWNTIMTTWWEEHVKPYFSTAKWQTELITPLLNLYATILKQADTTWETSIAAWFNRTKHHWQNLLKWWNTVTAEWFKDLSTVKWVNLMKWWDTSIKEWWDNRVVPWFKESLWEPQFMHIYNVAKRIFELVREVIHDKMSEAKEFCIECCDAMAESISHVISLVDELLDKLSQLESMSGSVNVSISGNIPHLAQGAVIPPNKEFMAVLGDQTSGTNIETPLSTMLEAFRSVMEEYGGARGPQNAIMEVDGETFARLMMPHVMDEMHRLGYNTEIIEGM